MFSQDVLTANGYTRNRGKRFFIPAMSQMIAIYIAGVSLFSRFQSGFLSYEATKHKSCGFRMHPSWCEQDAALSFVRFTWRVDEGTLFVAERAIPFRQIHPPRSDFSVCFH